MKKIITIIFCYCVFASFSVVLAETKVDCSKYNKDTILGTYDKWRCEQGKSERKPLDLKKKVKNIFKKN
tara:strand:+ start:737 stop:943 length:207 start_codon:yes stop_codon:yes gene_type:complete